jgi:hypothetical protein
MKFFKFIGTHWKTSLAGVVLVGGAVTKVVAPQFGGIADAVAMGAGGIGLISAADADKMQGIVSVIEMFSKRSPKPAVK